MTTILERVRDPELTQAASAKEFAEFSRLLVLAEGNPFRALEICTERRASDRVTGIFKSAIAAGTLTNWADVAGYRVISNAWLASLRSLAAFDRMLPDMVRAPLRSRGVVVTTGITGSTPNEGAIKVISSLAFGSALVELKKASAIISVSEEVVKLNDANSNALFDSELKLAVARATDREFIAALIAATTPIASAGNTYANVLADFKALFAAITTHAQSRLYFIVSPANYKNLAFITSAQGSPVLTVLQAASSVLLAGVIPSDQIAANAAVLVDASQLAGSSDVIKLDKTRQSSLQFETTPDSPPIASTTFVSLWQNNLVALRSERFYGYVILRPGAVASLSGVNY